jgi:hypothetical protein
MTFKEARQREKAEMTPLRYKFNYRVLPTYMAAFACLIAASIAVGETVTPDLWVLLPLGAAVALIAVMAAHGSFVARKEAHLELKSWAYLFSEAEECPEETLKTKDPETGIEYVLSQRGIKVLLPIAGRQVFDEVKENESFLFWEDVEIVLASDNFARRVRLALAVIDVSKRSVDGEYMPSDSEVHFLPLDQQLTAFVRKLGLDKRISVEWRYIQKHPTDAFRQILARGYIRTLIDENGKRVKRENADKLYLE